MLAASQQARQTFRHLWHQIALDFNRIIPALELACLKVLFSDDPTGQTGIEQMWVNQIDFDGLNISGILINAPNHLTSVQQGELVTFPLDRTTDWLCVLNEQVYGGYTIQVLRSHMSPEDRSNHDQAWGFNFPPPETVLIPDRNLQVETILASKLEEQLEAEPSILNQPFDQGRTILHQEALYGRTASVQTLLNHGADKTMCCDRGWTARDYAQSLQWNEVIALLDQ
jgi:uncharacterized protein YegJ (DUF2314 family)